MYKKKNNRKGEQSKLVKAIRWRKKKEFKLRDFTTEYREYVAAKDDPATASVIIEGFMEYVKSALVPKK